MTIRSQIRFKWDELKSKDGSPYSFPQNRHTVKRLPLEIGGIYRWTKVSKRGRERTTLYIGESSNLYNRLYGYLHQSKSQATSFRIGRDLKKLNRNGSSIRFEILRLLQSRFAGQKIAQRDLSSMHLRQAIEQTLIFREKRRGQCELNKEK